MKYIPTAITQDHVSFHDKEQCDCFASVDDVTLRKDDIDRINAIADILRQLEFLYSPDEAADWLLGPKDELEGKTPISILKVKNGERVLRKQLLKLHATANI